MSSAFSLSFMIDNQAIRQSQTLMSLEPLLANLNSNATFIAPMSPAKCSMGALELSFLEFLA